jgi:hypothetical protein
MHLTVTGCKAVDLIHLVRRIVQWCADTNMVMKLGLKLKAK